MEAARGAWRQDRIVHACFIVTVILIVAMSILLFRFMAVNAIFCVVLAS